MKFKKIKILALLMAFNLVACNIDTVDQSALSPTLALNNIAGVQSAVLSTYRRVWEFNLYGQQINIHGDAFADNVEIVNRTGRYEQENINGIGVYANRWGQTGFGEGCYGIVKDANYVLAYLPKLNLANVPSTATVTSQNVIDHLAGEAKFLRALAIFELLRVYSYEPGKEIGGFNLGVVLRDKPTLAVSDIDPKPRSTNLECYQFIEKDLQDAIAGLVPSANLGGWPSSLGTITFPYRATKAAAAALLARVYLYWGRYADADAQATAALGFLTVSAPVTSANYVASWSATPHTESIFELEIRASDFSGVDGANNSMNSITTNLLSGSQYCVAASAELIAAHESGDVRRNLYVTSAATSNKPQVRKWPAEKGAFVENIPVIRRAEMYLIQAESRARVGGNDAGAQTAINTLRTNRGLAATALTGQALIDLIMNERRVELAFEGHRFFDLKRLGLPITKNAATSVATIPANDFRILQQIPVDQILLSNGVLKQNPGY
ncbi:MAG: RagB/SusD family nutrient uptake outer membrane protein [Cyclobacteriaceae bacterium]|nr:RagB/SusD family nutrient uptake outer membrane protein [Cyclobacteriaceae bacterium]